MTAVDRSQQPGRGDRTAPRLRALRDERGWTQQEVAEQISQMAWRHHGKEVGVNVDMVGKWERGVKRPFPIYRQLLALVFETDAYSLGFGPSRAQSSAGREAERAARADGSGCDLDRAWDLLAATRTLPATNSGLLKVLVEYRKALHALATHLQAIHCGQQPPEPGTPPRAADAGNGQPGTQP